MHKGTHFAPRPDGKHPERPSRDVSLRGGNVFANIKEGEEQISEEEQISTAELPMKRASSFSFLWDWAKYRGSPPTTPHASLHDGNVFGGKAEPAGLLQPAIQPPKGMIRDRSIGVREYIEPEPWPMTGHAICWRCHRCDAIAHYSHGSIVRRRFVHVELGQDAQLPRTVAKHNAKYFRTWTYSIHRA